MKTITEYPEASVATQGEWRLEAKLLQLQQKSKSGFAKSGDPLGKVTLTHKGEGIEIVVGHPDGATRCPCCSSDLQKLGPVNLRSPEFILIMFHFRLGVCRPPKFRQFVERALYPYFDGSHEYSTLEVLQGK